MASMEKRSWSFLIVAAGTGSRIGGMPKQFRLLGDRPVWKWSANTAETLWREGEISELVLVVPERDLEEVSVTHGMVMPTVVVAGGTARAESALSGLRACTGSHVLIHDGARPFITVELCLRIMREAEEYGCAIPVLPANDSLEIKNDGDILCIDRINFFRVQTPQAFDRAKLTEAIEDYGTQGTDEAVAWEAARNKLHHAEGEDMNFKITSPYDWVVAQALVGVNKETRTGYGYDVHRFIPGRRLVLAGVEVPCADGGLLGHSDADIVIHAVMDAILGAAGEPDIGTLFPADSAQWKDADSTKLLQLVIARIRSKGWKIEWVDVSLTAQRPRLAPMIPGFIANLLPYLQEKNGKVNFNMKVKSGEECGSVGRGECMICHGVATLSRYGV